MPCYNYKSSVAVTMPLRVLVKLDGIKNAYAAEE